MNDPPNETNRPNTLDPPVTVRPAAATDAKAIGVLLREAGGAIADPVFGFGGADLTIRNMTRMAQRKGGLFSWDITTVAEVDGQVVGICSNLPGPVAQRRLRSTIWSFIRVYGFFGTLRLYRGLSTLRNGSPDVPNNDYQIVNVAVLREYRNRGIGRSLLESAHRTAELTGATSCSLTVIIENAGAQRLYSQLGYAPVDDAVDDGLLQLTGVSGLRLMTRTVDAQPSPYTRGPSNQDA